MKDAILAAINHNSGIKSVNLILNVMAVTNPQKWKHNDYVIEIEKLVSEGEIIELEYIDPDVDYRIKSIYFKKGTEFRSLNAQNPSEADVHRQSERNAQVPYLKD